MPDAGRADQVGVVAERSQGEFRFFKRDEAASLGNHFWDVVEAHAFITLPPKTILSGTNKLIKLAKPVRVYTSLDGF